MEMHLEMNGSVEGWRVLKLILSEIGLSDVEERGEFWLRAVLGHGELTVGTSWGASWGAAPKDGMIRAEGNHGCDFIVTGHLVFRIYVYDEAVATIKAFLTALSERTNMLFVLSFQYEEVRAIRDEERGFLWLW
ncbi:hypothetical protein WKW80_30370 [Variovorax humicola]|uniref:Uncharacterized protein n=1 Tax=Variovorax humicola TaxID=1769758 RepID=A0ABU8W9T1_9BURK